MVTQAARDIPSLIAPDRIAVRAYNVLVYIGDDAPTAVEIILQFNARHAAGFILRVVLLFFAEGLFPLAVFAAHGYAGNQADVEF